MIYLKKRTAMAILALVLAIIAVPLTARLLYPIPYRELIIAHAGAYQLDPRLVAAVIRVESRFNPDSVSSKGARGLMQIMPETAEQIADRLNVSSFSTDDLHDPAVNIAFGVWYLHDLLATFDGDLILALAAYNGGRGNVRAWLEERRIRPGAGEAGLDDVPFGETRGFVRRVLIDYRIYQMLYPSLGAV